MLAFNIDKNYNAKSLPEELTRRFPNYDRTEMLAVAAVFPTVQGEAPFAGRPAIFLRLAGCNRGAKVDFGCTFCIPSHLTTSVIQYQTNTGEPDQSGRVINEMMLHNVQVGDNLPTFAEKPSLTGARPEEAETTVKAVNHRHVRLADMVSIRYYSDLNGANDTLFITNEHPLLAFTAESPDVGEYMRADQLQPGYRLYGPQLGNPFKEQNNPLVIVAVEPMQKYEYRQMIQDQIAVGVIQPRDVDTDGETGLSVTNFSCAPHPTYNFNGIHGHNCDTFFAVGEQTRLLSFQEVAEKVSALAKLMPDPMLVITGGEPLLQAPALIPFLYFLDTIGEFTLIQFECNGDLLFTPGATALMEAVEEINESYEEDDDEAMIQFVFSPKRTVREAMNKAVLQYAEKPHCHIRLVISGDENSAYYVVPQALLEEWPHNDIWLSPLTEYKRKPSDTEIVDIAEDIDLPATRRNVDRAIHLAQSLGLKVSFQAHSYIGIK